MKHGAILVLTAIVLAAASMTVHASDTVTATGSFAFAISTSLKKLKCTWTGEVIAPSTLVAGKPAKIKIELKSVACSASSSIVRALADIRVEAVCDDKVIATSTVSFDMPPRSQTPSKTFELAVPPSCDSEHIVLNVRLVNVRLVPPETYGVTKRVSQSPNPLSLRVTLVKPGLPSVTVEPVYVVVNPGSGATVTLRVKAVGGDVIVERVVVSPPPLLSAAVGTGLPVTVKKGGSVGIRIVVRAVDYTSGLLNVTIYAAPAIDPKAVHTLSVYIPVLSKPPAPVTERLGKLEDEVKSMGEKLDEIAGMAAEAKRKAERALSGVNELKSEVESLRVKVEEAYGKALDALRAAKSVESIRETLGEVVSKLDEVSVEVRAAKSKAEKALGKLDEVEAKVRELAVRLEELEKRVEKLEEKVAKAKLSTSTVAEAITRTIAETATRIAEAVTTATSPTATPTTSPSPSQSLSGLASNPIVLAAVAALLVAVALLARR